MTLAEFRLLVGAPAKWVLNARALLGSGMRYSVAAAERLALTRLLNSDLGIPLPLAWTMAGSVLAGPAAPGSARLIGSDGILEVTIDVERLRSAIATRRAELVNLPPRRRAGRKPGRPSNPVAAAREYGFDVTLLEANLKRTPLQRLRQLDGMMAFSRSVRRKA